MNGLLFTDSVLINAPGGIRGHILLAVDRPAKPLAELSVFAQSIVARIVGRTPNSVGGQVALALSCALDFAGEGLTNIAADYLAAARYLMDGAPAGELADLL